MRSVISEGDRTFQSAVDAGREFGYSADYVARLCRTKKIDGRMIGRSWYVDRNALIEYIDRAALEKRVRAEQLAEERRQAFMNRVQESAPDAEPIVSEEIVAVTDALAKAEGELIEETIEEEIENIEVSQPRTSIESVFVLRAVLLSVMLVTSMILYVAVPHTQDATATIVLGAHKKIAALFHGEDKANDPESVQLVAQTISTEPAPKAEYPNEAVPADEQSDPGMVVIPSTGDQQADDIRIAELSESFSDEVEIIPDEFGNTGVIKPVFKHANGDEYLYLLVPIDEASSTESAALPAADSRASP